MHMFRWRGQTKKTVLDKLFRFYFTFRPSSIIIIIHLSLLFACSMSDDVISEEQGSTYNESRMMCRDKKELKGKRMKNLSANMNESKSEASGSEFILLMRKKTIVYTMELPMPGTYLSLNE